MILVDVLMLALGAVAAGAAFRVVRTAHVVRAGLRLVVVLGAVAALYRVLAAELVAWVQVLLRVGLALVLRLYRLRASTVASYGATRRPSCRGIRSTCPGFRAWRCGSTSA